MISISKKGLMRVGVISSIIFTLVFLGFLFVNFVVPAIAPVIPGEGPYRNTTGNLVGFWVNQSGSDGKIDMFFANGDIVFISANYSCSPTSVCNATLNATANFSDIGGDQYRVGVFKATNTTPIAGDITWALWEFNETIGRLSAVTITNIAGANVYINGTAANNSAGFSAPLPTAPIVLVNMSTPPGCPPSGTQLPPQIPLLNGSPVNVGGCWSNCTVEDRMQQMNSTHFQLCGMNFGGSTTNFTQVASTGNFSNFQFILDIPGKAMINFTQNVSMDTQQKAQALFEFAMKNAMSGGRLGVNESDFGGQTNRPNLTLSARLTLYNFTGRFGIPSRTVPSIGYRSTYGSGSFGTCPTNVCSGTTWDGQNLTFAVTGFSEYDIARGLGMVLNSPANFSYINNASLVSGAPFRNINFTFTPTWNATTSPTNATLYGNFTGTWAKNSTNSTPLVNNSINGINITVGSDGPYLWNVVIYSTTGGSDTNEANWTVTVDTVAPVLNATTPSNNAYIYGKSNQLFQVYGSDTNFNRTNVTLRWRIGAGSDYPNTALLNCFNTTTTNTSFICNNTVDVTLAADGEKIRYYFETVDNAINQGLNGTSTNYLEVTVDRTAPRYSNAATNFASGQKYIPSRNYGFQTTWTDTGSNYSTIIFESNFTYGNSTFRNTTATACGTNTYCANFTQESFKSASVGFAYKWYANDSVTPTGDANWNGSFSYTLYSFSLGDNPVNLYLNDSLNTNITQTYGATVNATGTVIGGSGVLYRNVSGTLTDVTTAENAQNVTLPFGVHLYLVNTSGNANYTTNSTASFIATVNQAPTTITYYINGTSSASNTNRTIASGMGINITITASNTQGTIKLYRDGVLVQTSGLGATLENITTYSGTPGFQWNMTAIYNGSQNYTASSSIWNYLKVETTPPTFTNAAVNITNATIIGKYGGAINVSAKWNDLFTLDMYWLYSNQTGSWAISNVTNFVAGNLSEITITPSSITLGYTFQAQIFANDTSNNTNSTGVWQWTIDNSVPILNTTTPVSNSYILGTSTQLFQVYAYDDTLNASNVTLHWRRNVNPNVWTNVTLNCFNITAANISFICNNTVGLNGLPDTDVIGYYFDATDQSRLYANNGTASSPLTTTIERASPTYSNNATNATVVGRYDAVLIYANWSNNVALDYAWLETNETGSPVNKTGFYGSPYDINLTAGQTWSNFTWTNSSLFPGTVVQWRIYANDTAGNQNATPIVTFSIDSTKPTWTSNLTNVTNATTIAKGAVINLTAVWNDNNQLSKYWLSSNETNSWVNGTATSFSSSNQSDTAITTSTATVGRTFQAIVYANDTSGNENQTGTFQWTIDGTNPTYALVTVANSSLANITEPVFYAPKQTYYFNISLSDNINVSTVIFEWNGANETTSPTAVIRNSTGGNFSFTKNDLGAGNYSFRWYFNDTSDNRVASTLSILNITQNITNPLNIYLNGSTANLTVTYPNQVNATLIPVNIMSGTAYIYRNESDKTSENYTNVRLANATYEYKFNITGNVNYTSNGTGASYYVFVIKGATTISLFIDSQQANKSVAQGANVNFTATVNTIYDVTINLTTNVTNWGTKGSTNSRVENISNTLNYTAANFYNVTAWFNVDQNYTASSATYWLNITSDTTGPVVKLFDPGLNEYNLNNASARKSGLTINLNVSVVDSGIGIPSGEMCFAVVGGGTAQNFANNSNGWCNGTITVPSISDGPQILNITINDTNDYVGVNQSFYITVDNTPPILIITTPTNGTYNKRDSNSLFWINGTISDNLQMGTGNVTINGTQFNSTTAGLPFSFTGGNNTAFSFRNYTATADGYYAFRVNYADNATNVVNATIYFYLDDTAPSASYGLTNSTSGKYQPNSSQTIQVRIDDAVQTNATITLNYTSFTSGTQTWTTSLMTGTPGTSTVYTATVDTSNPAAADSWIIRYYITGVDNATNSMTAAVGGSESSPKGTVNISTYCGSNGIALSYCSYDEGWQALSTGATNRYHQVHWSTEQLTGASSLSSNYNISNVLSSISGKFSYVYYKNITSTGTQWLTYDPSIAWNLNTLRFGNNTNTEYYINITSTPATIRIS